MKKISLFLLLVPLLAISQNKTIVNSTRMFPKEDKYAAFRKALANHAQKFHTGNWAWRVWSIESGPDVGGYMVAEGPNTWEDIDNRNDISDAHTADFDNNVAPLTSGAGKSDYGEFQQDLSTVQLTDYANKIHITHITMKPGKTLAVKELITKMKKVWEAGKESVAVYLLVGSGDPGYTVVTRLKNGFKELAADYRKPVPERYNEVYGGNGWDSYLKDYADAVERRWTELLIYQPKLSSSLK